MIRKANQYSLEGIKNEILDATLVTGSIVGILAYMISLYKWISVGFHFSYIINFAVVGSFVTITYFRKRMSVSIKTYTIIFLLIFFTLMDVVFYGLFSAARIYIVLIPFFCILFLSLRQSEIIYMLTLMGFILAGILHHLEILSLPSEYIPEEYIVELYPWIINAIHILLVGIIILLITRKFFSAYQHIVSNQESLIKERTDDLLATNEELKATTEELAGQKEELEGALNMLQATQNQLIESEKMASLGVLAAGVAHEINNPLNFINGGVIGIENYLNEKIPDHKQYLKPLIEDVNTGIRRASEIVSNLDFYTRHEDVPREKCDVHSIIDSCLIMLNHRFKNKVDLVRKYTNQPCFLLAQEGKLHQVFLNILTNAEQSIEKNGIIEIETRITENDLEVLIRDNGCGINESDISKITDPFFTSRDPGKGTGLGLAITKSILQRYNAVLKFNSKVGAGTTVSIIFPLKQE